MKTKLNNYLNKFLSIILVFSIVALTYTLVYEFKKYREETFHEL